jgi:hypothetical protein
MLLDLPQSVMSMYARRLSCCLAIILEEHGANKRTSLLLIAVPRLPSKPSSRACLGKSSVSVNRRSHHSKYTETKWDGPCVFGRARPCVARSVRRRSPTGAKPTPESLMCFRRCFQNEEITCQDRLGTNRAQRRVSSPARSPSLPRRWPRSASRPHRKGCWPPTAAGRHSLCSRCCRRAS